METEDKVAFTVLIIVIGGVVFGLMWGVKIIGSTLFGWFITADTGMGFKDALIYSLVLSTFLMVLFTLVAGDGLVGELPSMLIGFFLFVAFFTLSLAWIF
ncbi:MAG: hypothetical protein HQK65_07375 [Desulfamplus sp.]|nr:hypothetical protein [Desulfamplus sp.]